MYQILTEDPGSLAVQVLRQPKFSPGQIVATPAALATLEEYNCSPLDLLARHLSGDWGSVPVEDASLNDSALQSGGRLLSNYSIGPDTRIWLITEADRSATILLLPTEY